MHRLRGRIGGMIGGYSLSFVPTSCLVVAMDRLRSCQYHTPNQCSLWGRKRFVKYFISLFYRLLCGVFGGRKINESRRACYSLFY